MRGWGSRFCFGAIVALLACAATAGAESRIHSYFNGGAAPVTTGRTPHGLPGSDAETCAGCHTEIAAEWRESQHSQSWTDEVFQAAYEIEPMAFCRNCHAPRMARGAAVPDALAAREGVSCAVCHVRRGRVLGPSTPGGDISSRRGAPHGVIAVREMSASSFCAGCHQFNFPADPGPHRAPYASDEPMQDTYEEWRMSSAFTAGVQCQDCHMPWTETSDGRRWRSHRFVGGSDPAMLRRAVAVDVTAVREGAELVVTATVSPREAGHSFPTGDLFRRGELKIWLDGDESHAQVIAFARGFSNVLEHTPTGEPVFIRRQSTDSRVPPPGLGPPPTYVVRLPARGTTPRVRWAFDYLLMPTPLAASQGFSTPRNQTRVHEGVVVPTPARAPTPLPRSVPVAVR